VFPDWSDLLESLNGEHKD
jgi:hypothetical protein